MKKFGLLLTACTCLAVGLMVLSVSDPRLGDPAPQKKKIDLAKLKKILKKIDPEIKAAQNALQASKKTLATAKARIKAAIEDEVFGEKGPTEGRVIDLLKASLQQVDRALVDVNAAIKSANVAQLIDKGGG